MTCKGIIKAYLSANGYDGLAGNYCGCLIDDLIPCEQDFSQCVPGYKVPCDSETCEEGGGCLWHISTEKPGDFSIREDQR